MRWLLIVLVVACRSYDLPSDANNPIDAPPDGVEGSACDPTSPRTVPIQAFVGPTGLQDRAAALIDSATKSLDIQMYLFSVADLAHHVVAARARGVSVRVIMDPDEAGNDPTYTTFTAGGVPWKTASRVYTYAHAKYLIIDRTTAVIMSMNFNADAMTTERNYGMVDTDPEDVTDLQTVFEQDWALANGKSPPTPDLSCTRLITSPVNSDPRILALIASATTTLEVEVMYITDGGIQSAIGLAYDRGVNVRVILENPNDQAENAAVATYYLNKGIPVKYAVDQFYLHAKLIIADGTALVGSENMSPTSMTMNREMGALVFEPDQEAIIAAQFEADWAITTSATQ
jgi:cardiolipin synthase